ncbi:MAG TPA: hypothetical protein VFA76_06630 [Terriglobales bacterium]|nr:hypothetical protein [Terriglobales bacterium]
MSTYVEDLLTRFESKGALVDTNLLLLLLIGFYDRTLIGNFKRVAAYTLEDFLLLAWLLEKKFKTSVTTPHVLTEVSNLAGQIQENRKAGCFKQFVETFCTFTELTSTSFSATARPEFPYLGLTDCVIAEWASHYLVITDDLPFWDALGKAGLDALNFNHIRTMAWKMSK